LDAARRAARGRHRHAILTSDPTPLRAIDPAVAIEELPDV
jgi:hypothetical protein